jgi:hypothetical protein
MAARRFRKLVISIAVLALCGGLLWCVATAALYSAMRQPPERFGAIMKRVPMVAMMVLPFQPLWNSARAGVLNVGDPAPDFSLPGLNGQQTIRLSEEYRRKPVVLIFGSYT